MTRSNSSSSTTTAYEEAPIGVVLIVANPADIHGRFLAKTLEGRGHEVRFLHVAPLGSRATFSFRAGASRNASIRNIDTVVHLDDVTSVWYRRQAHPELPEEVSELDDRRFAAREWGQALDAALLSLDARFVNPLTAQRSAVKPRQLVVAASCGLRVPDTLVTSDPTDAAEFIDLHEQRVIHKTMSSPRRRFAATVRWDDRDREALPSLVVAPTIFQEEICGHSDVRATIVGDRIFTARMTARPGMVDSRLSKDSAHESWTLPDGVTGALLRLMRELGLVFGTVDMKITSEDEYVFFEVNPQGQFLYVQMLTGLPIAEALADLLLDR